MQSIFLPKICLFRFDIEGEIEWSKPEPTEAVHPQEGLTSRARLDEIYFTISC